jgi:hypothetical protein
MKMFANNRELLIFIQDLIERLQSAQENEWADAFKNAMAISFMPGELLGEVRLTFRNFQKTDIPKQLNLEREIKEALEALNQALNH